VTNGRFSDDVFSKTVRGCGEGGGGVGGTGEGGGRAGERTQLGASDSTTQAGRPS
jgi:hypothetical protein